MSILFMVYDNDVNIFTEGWLEKWEEKWERKRQLRQLKQWEMEQKQKFLAVQTESSSDSERIKQISDK